MGVAALTQRLCNFEIRRLVLIIGVAVVIVVVNQCFELPYGKRFYFSPADTGSASVVTLLGNVTGSNDLESGKFDVVGVVGIVVNNTGGLELEEFELEKDASNVTVEKSFPVGINTSEDDISSAEKTIDFRHDSVPRDSRIGESYKLDNDSKTSSASEFQNEAGIVLVVSQGAARNSPGNINAVSKGNFEQTTDIQVEDKKTEPLQSVSVTLHDNSSMTSISTLRKWNPRPTSISQMNLLLLRTPISSSSMNPRRYSTRDRELQSVKLELENAPIIRDNPGLSASIFRNLSIFIRSYDLMEQKLKVYVYTEGEKPIFHQPLMRGIYASEGWFMKLIEGNKRFSVRDPRKAHLFYLPFDSHMLRLKLNGTGKQGLEKYLKRYVGVIAKKYPFWNRTGGADHFLVACHDWAPKITSKNMGTCIRSLCNANVARDFKIGKDTSLPVTYIRSVEDPLADLGGKPASERSILAFFAGGMHGYLRPILLHYWENKEPDMKIFGPMPRDIESKRLYREYMKSSKYCICARGYEVHTPRIVEAIFHECVPVIISDNYVPPFFEVFNWEAFSVFIQEKDIPYLRNILLSIPDEKYLMMKSEVKMVQQHFFWHKKPVKYDLFHMILHSVWYNRILQIKK
ncbi:putative xylogalacturonan beta-1,3-xylosyltransferase [Rosa chinensis]|uniref:Putative xylogalacturonan beta-1,3-xylosyltransferase n=1 Tax=Rosa chinensis TaxID=74649 RepID=A0A2P6RJQ4_ROSCH|nr:probable glycosyltransferase At3g07620 [Rosa chinensis]PRQ46662.1 putative xylogalacturonan beta-1,3-xylosyltransferase [Rosa chinensis]